MTFTSNGSEFGCEEMGGEKSPCWSTSISSTFGPTTATDTTLTPTIRAPPWIPIGDGSTGRFQAPTGSGNKKCTCRICVEPTVSNSTKSMPLTVVWASRR